jgi:hypothetical protein
MKIDLHHFGWKISGAFIVLSLCIIGYIHYSKLIFGQKQLIELTGIERETRIHFSSGSVLKNSEKYSGLPYSYMIAEIYLPPGDKTISEFQLQERLENEGWSDDVDSAAAVRHKINAKRPDWQVEMPTKSLSMVGRLWDIGGTSVLINMDNPQQPKVYLCIEKNE